MKKTIFNFMMLVFTVCLYNGVSAKSTSFLKSGGTLGSEKVFDYSNSLSDFTSVCGFPEDSTELFTEQFITKKRRKGGILDYFGTKKTTGLATDYGDGRGAFVKSMILPGWGLTKTLGSKKYLINTPVIGAFSLLGLNSIRKTRKSYKSYSDSRNQVEMEKVYKEIKTNQSLARTWFAVAGIIYVYQVFRTYSTGKYNEFYKKRAAHWAKNVAVGFIPDLKKSTKGVSICANLQF